VTIIIPARNEARGIGTCLDGVRAQDYPADRLEVVVVDDNSTDGTSAEARRAAGGDPRVKIVSGAPLARGWTGKCFACWQGAQRSSGDWLLFLDADTVPRPSLVRTAVDAAASHGDAMVSLEPFQELGTFWERLMIPAGLFVVACTQDLRRFDDPRDPDATANGQCLLIDAAVYRQVGGHAAVRQKIAEDRALALRVKHSGHRVSLVGAEEFVHTRMYTDFKSLWEGLAKNLCDRFSGVVGTLAAAAGGLAVAAMSVGFPIWAAVHLRAGTGPASIAALCLACGGSLALLCVHIGTARHFRIAPWYGFLFPLAYLADSALAIHAVQITLKGRTGWKGRVYPSSKGDWRTNGASHQSGASPRALGPQGGG
jgi:chlorobactene glucosyltransferase